MKSNSKHASRAMVGLLFTLLVIGQPVRADDRESLEALRETTLNLIDALVEQKVFSREQADTMVKAAQAKAAKTVAAEKPKAGAPVRVQYVPETVKNEIRDQLRQEVLAQAKAERWAEPNAVPSWLDRIMWEGDLRLDVYKRQTASRRQFRQLCKREKHAPWNAYWHLRAGVLVQCRFGVGKPCAQRR